MKLRTLALAGVALGAMALAAPAAKADLVRFSVITAAWSNVAGGTNVNFAGNGTANASVSWGTPVTAQSGYDFAAVAVPTAPVNVNPPAVSSDFDLGTFTHRNRPINAGTSITGATLTVTGTVELDNGSGFVAIAPPKNFIFDFTHDETPNGANPCAYGGANGQGVNINGCADRVTVSIAQGSESFNVGGVEYTLDIQGFKVSNVTQTAFLTIEDAVNNAVLVANIRAVTVPEPASLALLGAGLVGLGLAARRRRKAA